MKFRNLAFLALFGGVLAGAGAAAEGVSAAEGMSAAEGITTVTLYPDGARVEREWRGPVQAGAGVLDLPPLPSGIDPRSVQVAVPGDGDFVVEQIETRILAGTEVVNPRERALREERQEWLDEQRRQEDVQRANALRLRFIERLAEGGEGETTELPVEHWEDAWNRIGSGAADVLAGMQAVDLRLREIRAELDRIERELNRFRTAQRDRLGVRVQYRAARAADQVLRITYDVGDAAWRPEHEARLNTETGILELRQFAAVRQNSGEDWAGVTLRLAPARPRAGGVVPGLDPRYLDIGAPVAARLFSESAPTLAELDQSMALAPAAVEVSGWSRQYRVDGDVTLASDNREQRLLLSTESAPATLSLRVVPLRSPFAHVVASLRWPESSAPVLPGPIRLLQDGQRVGDSRLSGVAPGTALELGFGVDDSLVIERIENPHLDAQRGLIRRDNQQERGFLIRVFNGADSERNVLVIDRVPVPRDARIEVVRDRANTRPDQENFDDIPGLLAWERRLSPGEETEIRWQYTVTWPMGEAIQGLP